MKRKFYSSWFCIHLRRQGRKIVILPWITMSQLPLSILWNLKNLKHACWSREEQHVFIFQVFKKSQQIFEYNICILTCEMQIFWLPTKTQGDVLVFLSQCQLLEGIGGKRQIWKGFIRQMTDSWRDYFEYGKSSKNIARIANAVPLSLSGHYDCYELRFSIVWNVFMFKSCFACTSWMQI